MKTFRTTRRIEFGDTDMAGIVHFANFFRYMESAETEFLRSLGFSVSYKDGDKRFGFPRVSTSCDFFKPARFEDVLDVAVTVERIGTKSVTYRFEFTLKGESVAIGHITAVYCLELGHVFQSLEITDDIRAKMEEGAPPV
jgi:YbgC/YbaW family acyl-CoA thioester hydrolase